MTLILMIEPYDTSVPDFGLYHELDSPAGMSNASQHIEPALEDRLRRPGTYTHHAGWNHNGRVWFSGGQFHEQVKVYRSVVGVYSADTLRELMHVVNEAWGWK